MESAVYNSLGKLEAHKLYPGGSSSQSLSLEQLPAGLYLVCIKIGNETIRQKIVKQ